MLPPKPMSTTSFCSNGGLNGVTGPGKLTDTPAIRSGAPSAAELVLYVTDGLAKFTPPFVKSCTELAKTPKALHAVPSFTAPAATQPETKPNARRPDVGLMAQPFSAEQRGSEMDSPPSRALTIERER